MELIVPLGIICLIYKSFKLVTAKIKTVAQVIRVVYRAAGSDSCNICIHAVSRQHLHTCLSKVANIAISDFVIEY
jgi:hypothetical protein